MTTEAIRRYWNERIHDLEMTSHPVGSREFFADLDDYRFDKLSGDVAAVLDGCLDAQPDGRGRTRRVHLVGHDWGSIQGWHFVCDDSLQIDGDKLKLHKQAVVCEAGKLFSSEGGGALFYEGSLQRTKGRAKLRYSRCDRCLANLKKPSSLNLTIEVMAPDVIQMGGVKYSKAAKPYPEHCPPLD